MEQMDGRRNTFTDWSDEETDGEIDDQDVNKILIVTQTPPYLKKHPGGDRTGHHTSRAKLTSELVKVINDGLFYYEQDLWDDKYEPEYATIKVSSLELEKKWPFSARNSTNHSVGQFLAQTEVLTGSTLHHWVFGGVSAHNKWRVGGDSPSAGAASGFEKPNTKQKVCFVAVIVGHCSIVERIVGGSHGHQRTSSCK